MGAGYQFRGEVLASRSERTEPGTVSDVSGPQCAPTNLPAPTSDLIGRDVEIGSVIGLVADHRFVTLTGAPGSSRDARCEMQLEAALGLSLFDTEGPVRETGAAWTRALAIAGVGQPRRHRVGAMRSSGWRALKTMALGYIEAVRSIPFVILLFFVFFAVPLARRRQPSTANDGALLCAPVQRSYAGSTPGCRQPAAAHRDRQESTRCRQKRSLSFTRSRQPMHRGDFES